jgi:ATP-dependent helicase/nuclease subunit B
MLPSLIDISLFRDAIENNQLILTANQRLAAQIQQAWGQSIDDQTTVWQAPRVMSMEHWLSDCWHQLQDQNHPLTKGLASIGQIQSLYYWEYVIAQQGQPEDYSFAPMVNDCLGLLQRWNLEIDGIPSTSSAVHKFKRWATSYKALLDKQGLATIPSCWVAVRDGFTQSALPREQQIAVYGFQSLSPLQQSILQAASDQIVEIQACSQNLQQLVVQCTDPAQELQAASSWAAKQLSAQPEQRIGILLPNLSADVQQVARVINEALADENCSTSVNITAGTKLSETPLVASAFDLLQIFNYQLPLEHWLRMLYSPYSNMDQLPLQFRVNCELALRERKNHQLNFDQFVQQIRACQAILENPHQVQPLLEPLYSAQQKTRQNANKHKTFTDWAVFFDTHIKTLGWPGVKQLDSLQYQQQQHWDRLLTQYAELDNLGIEVSRSKALNYLQRMANEHLFHPQTGDAPLQVLGLLEAVGLQFDQLWVVGMHSGNLPTNGTMDPILPANLQRQYQMPFSVPEQELKIGRKLLSGFQSSAKQLILSFPLTDGKTPLEQSPLIVDIPQYDLPTVVEGLGVPRWLDQPHQCQLIEDCGFAFDNSVESIRGGSSVLKNQSTCPFNAFAIHRLWAVALEQPSLGLQPVDRGSIVHEILYRLWNDWKTSQALTSLSDMQRNTQIEDIVATVLAEKARYNPWLQGDNFTRLEQQRLTKLMVQWIAIEQQRQPFEVIATEHKTQLCVAGLNISLTIDRLDLIDGQTVVIDYKTGTVNANDWLGDRPKDPQLPLYALATEPLPTACVFASLKVQNLKFKGLTKEQLLADVKVVDDWQVQIDQWNQAINNLACEFVEGKASLDIYNRGQFAYQTDLLPLNRWHEQADIQRLLTTDNKLI